MRCVWLWCCGWVVYVREGLEMILAVWDIGTNMNAVRGWEAVVEN